MLKLTQVRLAAAAACTPMLPLAELRLAAAAVSTQMLPLLTLGQAEHRVPAAAASTPLLRWRDTRLAAAAVSTQMSTILTLKTEVRVWVAAALREAVPLEGQVAFPRASSLSPSCVYFAICDCPRKGTTKQLGE